MYIFLRLAGVCFENFKIRDRGVPFSSFVVSMGLSLFFWSLYDQTSSAWVLQAQHMDRQWLGVEWLPSQIQAVNPILILILIPCLAMECFRDSNRS